MGGSIVLSKAVISGSIIVMMLVSGLVVTDHYSSPVMSQSGAGYSQPQGRRLGFWVAEDDIFGGAPIFGNANGVAPTPQQFYNSYFMTQPYPTTMVLTGGMAYGESTEATWFNQLLAITDQNPNILIWAIFFVNLSGYSIEGAQQAPAASTGLISTGFSVQRDSPLTTFKIGNSAGLSPNTRYTLNMEDINLNLIGTVTTFTTNSTGGWTGTTGLPNTTDAQANAGGYLVVQGTHIGLFIGWTNDQTADFTSFMNTIKGHPSFIGALFEPEYFGDTTTIQASFQSIVNGAGYYVLGGTNDPANGELEMDFSAYPYSGGAIQTGTASSGDLGMHYGETGAPIAANGDPVPAWTQANVLSIVEQSESAPITIIIAVEDQSNPIGNSYLYMNPTLRGWIASDNYYKANYLTANGPYITTTSTSTYSTSQSVTSTTVGAGTSAGVVFSSYMPSPSFALGTNFATPGNKFTLEIPTTSSINTIAFYFSDRGYDPNPVPFTISDSSGEVITSGTIPALLQFASQQYYPIQLSQAVTLKANTPYTVQFASLPAGDNYGGAGVSQDILTEAASNGSTYLGLSQWPIFEVGMMNLFPQSEGLAYHNYGGYTDLFSSPGYQGNSEIAMRFLASQNEQLQSFEFYAWSTDGSSNQLTFALRPDAGGYPGTSASNIATASLAANQVTAGTFATVNFPTAPSLIAGAYYWIVISSPSGTQPVVFGRLVNPYREYVLYSGNDFSSSWGVPPDGPTDLGFRINTSGESIVNTISGSSDNDYFSGIAQSFEPSISTTVSGAWLSAEPDDGRAMTVSIQTDNGNDQPSGTILASGSNNIASQFTGGEQPFVYVGFTGSAVVNAGTKYWLVATIGSCPSSCSNPSKAATLTFGSDYSLSGFAPPPGTHYEMLSGSTWTSISNGAMTFELVAPAGAPTVPPVTTTTTTTSTSGAASTTTTSTTSTKSTTTTTTTSTATATMSSQTTSATSTFTTTYSRTSSASATSFLSSSSTLPSFSSSSSSSYSSATTSSEATSTVTSIFTTTYSIFPTQGGCYQSPCPDVTTSPTMLVQSNTAGPVAFMIDGEEYYTPAAFVWPTGSNHTVTLPSETVDTSVEKSTFLGWTGSINSSSTSLNFTVKGDMNLDLDFRNLCLVNIGFTDVEGQPVNLAPVQISAGSQTLNLTSPSVWLYSGTYQVTQAYWKGVELKSPSNSTISFNVSKPGDLPIMLPIFDEVVVVTDVYGLPVQGATVTLAAGGIVQERVTNGSGIALFAQIPPGPVQGTIKYLTFSQNFSSQNDSSRVIYATATLSYPLLITILAAAALAAFVTIRSVRKKTSSGGYIYFFRDEI